MTFLMVSAAVICVFKLADWLIPAGRPVAQSTSSSSTDDGGFITTAAVTSALLSGDMSSGGDFGGDT